MTLCVVCVYVLWKFWVEIGTTTLSISLLSRRLFIFFFLFPCQPPLISISYFVVKRYTGHGQHERVLVSQLHAISSKDKQAASRYLII